MGDIPYPEGEVRERSINAILDAGLSQYRQSFWGFLSDVFHFEGFHILLPQLGVFFAACLALAGSPLGHYDLPPYMPLFILAVTPVFFKGQRYQVSEVEAATRTSGALLALARLVLAGGGALVCLTLLLRKRASMAVMQVR